MDTTTTTKEATPRTAVVITYEQQTCGRCGGCGSYSYNQITGSRCFKCHGAGTVDSRKGAKARAAVAEKRNELYGRAIEDVKVGDRAKMPGRGMFAADRWATITESQADDLNAGFWSLRCDGSGLGAQRGHRMHVFTPEAAAAILDFAATLKGCTVGPKAPKGAK